MKISIKHHGIEHITEKENDDLTITEVTLIIKNLLISSGFFEQLIINEFKEIENEQ